MLVWAWSDPPFMAQVLVFLFGLRTEGKGLWKATNFSHSLYPKSNSSYSRADTSRFLSKLTWNIGKGLWLGFFVLRCKPFTLIQNVLTPLNGEEAFITFNHSPRKGTVITSTEPITTLSSPRAYWMLLGEIRYLSHLYDIGNNFCFLMFTLY